MLAIIEIYKQLRRRKWQATRLAIIGGLALSIALLLYFRSGRGVVYLNPRLDWKSKFTFDDQDITESILFAGDGGDVRERTSKLLRSESLRLPKQTSLVFLGDNIYPNGIPAPDAAGYQESLSRLERQLAIVRGAGLQSFFIPGNHDWGGRADDGRERLKRQQIQVEESLGSGSFIPHDGCPGPLAFYRSEHFRFIALDTQWWLVKKSARPSTALDGCPVYTEKGVIEALDKLLGDPVPGIEDIVYMHHPLQGGGRHMRRSHCPQNAGCPIYAEMRRRLLEVFERHRPFLCASGHDHSLQLMKFQNGCQYYLTSGALSNTTVVVPTDEYIFSFEQLGFIRLDVLPDKRIALTAFRFWSWDEYEKTEVWLEASPRKP